MKPKPTISAASARMHKLHDPRVRGQIMTELYGRAEAHLRARLQDQRKAKAGFAEPDTGPERLLHELEVHQIELELQNTELQKARDELELALGKFTDLYDFAPVGYFSLDESGVILESNLTGAALLGLERSRLLKRRLPLFMAPASRPGFLAFLNKVFAGSVEQSCEVLLLKEGGGTFWAGCRATPAIALKGALKWCRVAVSDIAVRKQAEEVLRRNEALFSALIEQAPIGVYVVDARFRLQQVNRKARPLFRRIHPLIGRDFSEVHHILWPGRAADQIVARFRHTLKTGEPYLSPEAVHRHPDTGAKEIYEWQIQRLTLPGGEFGVVAFFNNITERKRVEGNQRRLEVLTASNLKLEQEIVRRQAVEEVLKQSEQHQIELLEESRQMQSQLRHMSRQVLRAQEEERKRISRELHDVIAQTLTGINVRLTALKQEATFNTKGLARKIARTQRLVEHSVSIVHRFARELRPTALDDLGLIPALHAFMKGFKQDTGIQVSLSAFREVEQVTGDERTVLYRVAQEALTNISHHAEASHAHVNIQKLDGVIRMKIQDDGKGFQAERLLHAREQKRLGLLGMRERVEMVNGSFTVESRPGQGTTIIAQIPLAKIRGGGGPENPVMGTGNTKV